MKAAIDIGSNTVRLLIGEVCGQAGQRRVRVESQHLRTTRLGQTPAGSRLDPAAVARTLEALREFQRILLQKGITEAPVVAATSAVREAADQAAFQHQLLAAFGWQLQILSGPQEAALSYRGAAGALAGQAAVIDVGGGSTELVWQQQGKVQGQSVKVGAVRLARGEVTKAQLPVVLQPLAAALPALPDRQFVAVGGTVTTAAALQQNLQTYCREAISGVVLTVASLQHLYAELSPLTGAQRLARYPLLQNREDIILDGLEIYLTLADLIGFDSLTVSDAGILDGLLLANAE